jgi:hypothetical protein
MAAVVAGHRGESENASALGSRDAATATLLLSVKGSACHRGGMAQAVEGGTGRQL